MIIDKIANHTRYHSVHPLFAQAFKYLTTTNFSDFDTGKYPIDGNNMFALVNDYLTKNDGQLEGHEEYIDIQFLVSGEENMGYAPLNNQKVAIPYNPEKDIAFFEGGHSMVKVETGMFVVFFPTDLHLPGIKVDKPTSVKKVVIKVKLSSY